MKIKQLRNFAIIGVLGLITACWASPAFAQETVPVPVDDLKQLRKLAADREFWKSSFEESQAQKSAAIQSAADWQKLYVSEKDRADRVQGGRVTESQAANGDLQKANAELHQQADRDRQKIGELTAENNQLRSERKWYFGGGFIVGGVAGWFLRGKSEALNFTTPFTARSVAERRILKPIADSNGFKVGSFKWK